LNLASVSEGNQGRIRLTFLSVSSSPVWQLVDA
jgi:hypothetical protein